MKFSNEHPHLSMYEIGEFTYGNPKVISWGAGSTLKIGKYCCISEDVLFLLNSEHRKDWVTTYPFIDRKINRRYKFVKYPSKYIMTRGDTIVGNDVWIGYGATIGSGVTISDGSIIGLKSIVIKDVAPYSIVAGNPAREIGKRFPQEIIDKLLKIKWWNWPKEKIRDNVKLFEDINSFVKVFHK